MLLELAISSRRNLVEKFLAIEVSWYCSCCYAPGSQNIAQDNPIYMEILENKIIRVADFRVGLIKRQRAAIPDRRTLSSKYIPRSEWLNALRQVIGIPSKLAKPLFQDRQEVPKRRHAFKQ